MNRLTAFILALSIASCVSPPNKNKISTNTELHFCERLSDSLASMALLKWAFRNTPKTKGQEKLSDWGMMAFVSSEELSGLGLSIDEIGDVAEQIYNTDISSEAKRDTLSYGYYFKAKCELEGQGITPLTLLESAQTLDKCWIPEYNLGLERDACFKKVLSKEIVL